MLSALSGIQTLWLNGTPMLYPLAAIIVGIAVLVAGADRFVAGAAAVARHFGLPPLLIGIVVVGFGTSAPEMLVSATGAWNGSTGIALGNAYGSNITNILLILGLCAAIRPMKVTQDAIRRELPSLLFVTAVTFVLLWNGTVSRLDAVVMLAVFACCMGLSVRQSLAKPAEAAAVAEEIPAGRMSPGMAAFWIVAGLGLMIVSSELLVWGAVSVARHFGVSDLVIGLTIVAIGTSLPELASSAAASLRGEDDLAVGNIIGSNIFNTMMVVGLAGVIHPLGAEPALLSRDLPVMAGATILLYVFCRFRPSAGIISRVEGIVFLALYIAYTTYLIAMPAAA